VATARYAKPRSLVTDADCQNMKPAYENVARAFASEPDCVVAHMNADEADNKPIASKYDVRSFPTIKFFPKGSKTPIAYESGRSEGQFVEVCPYILSLEYSTDDQFLNQHCGTHRSAGGLLTDQAGRVLSLDTLASNFFTADLPSRSQVIAQAKEYVASISNSTDKKVSASATYYLKAMERVMEKGEAWVSKEQAR
jgi:protein disulfide-isomerase A6